MALTDRLQVIRVESETQRTFAIEIMRATYKQEKNWITRDEKLFPDEELGNPGVSWFVALEANEPVGTLRIELKYGHNGEQVIQHVKRISTPGRRVYAKAKELKPVLNGMGISVLSTSRGMVSDREARQRNIGGEVLCQVW